MKLNRSPCSLFMLPLLVACSSSTSDPSTPTQSPSPIEPAPPVVREETVEAKVARFLEGSFDSKDQAKADTTYLPISLQICKATVPTLGERVLYVEQARIGSAPYRQRLYVVEPVDATSARSRVFELADPKAMVGACDEKSPRKLLASDAVERAGCVVEMHFTTDGFLGHTPDQRWSGTAFVDDPKGQRCASDFQGSTYASTEVKLDSAGLFSWDRGWDDAGQQVWGATKGAYHFVRRSPLADPAP